MTQPVQGGATCERDMFRPLQEVVTPGYERPSPSPKTDFPVAKTHQPGISKSAQSLVVQPGAKGLRGIINDGDAAHTTEIDYRADGCRIAEQMRHQDCLCAAAQRRLDSLRREM